MTAFLSKLFRDRCNGITATAVSISSIVCATFLLGITAQRLVLIVILAHHKAPEKHHCKGEYLKRASFLIGSHAIGSHARKQASEILSLFRAADQRRPGSRETGCAIRYFRKADIVKCLDEFRDRRSGELATILNATKERPSDRALHIAFLGDSRIRQQFLSFSQLLPLYDLKVSTFDPLLHSDRYFTSPMLNLVLSFAWRPSLIEPDGDDVTRTLKRWLDYERFSTDDASENTPDFLLLGTTLHEMIDNKNLEAYTKGLQRVKPLLNELSKATRVVWLNAYPVTDESAVPYPEINQLKVQEYNKLTWRTFRDSRIELWDSMDPMAEEYIRACSLWKRDSTLGDFGISFKCGDRIHTGNAVANPSTHLLLNEMCYEFLSDYSEKHWTS